jgi:arylsulfatase A-like enzyme
MVRLLPPLTFAFYTTFCGCGTSEQITKEASQQPNIIVIFTDDQVWSGIGYDNPEVKTPHLDKLAAGGVIFERAYVASPICAASRASMMTGLFPQQHGVIALENTSFDQYRTEGPKADQALAGRLKQAGYTTAFFGKSHLGDPQTYGFDTGAEIRGHDDVETFRQASEFIASRKEGKTPFFLWLAPRQPHVPLYPEQQWLDKYPAGSYSLPKNYRLGPTKDTVNNQGTPDNPFYRDSKYRKNINKLPAGPPRDEETMLAFIQAYYAVVSRLDSQVGNLIDLLREKGLMENTIIFFLSDNGYHLGSHGLGNKITMHEESVRVPMFAYGAGVSQGKKSRALVSSLDIYPTLLELTQAPAPPQSVMGKSLVSLLNEPASPHREFVFSECVGVGGKAGEGHRMARNDRWKLILSTADEEFLFDQEKDPAELTNRIADSELQPIVKKLRSELSEWMKSIGDRPYPSNKNK